jgi:hypothetical protein
MCCWSTQERSRGANETLRECRSYAQASRNEGYRNSTMPGKLSARNNGYGSVARTVARMARSGCSGSTVASPYLSMSLVASLYVIVVVVYSHTDDITILQYQRAS